MKNLKLNGFNMVNLLFKNFKSDKFYSENFDNFYYFLNLIMTTMYYLSVNLNLIYLFNSH